MVTADINSKDIDRLIAVVAERHKVILDKSDPILVTTTINELILKKYLAQSRLEVQNLQKNLDALYADQENQIKANIRTLIKSSQQSMKDSFVEASEEFIQTLIKQTVLLSENSEATQKAIRFNRNLTFLFAVSSLASLCTILMLATA